jgi:hypothetical protein
LRIDARRAPKSHMHAVGARIRLADAQRGEERESECGLA